MRHHIVYVSVTALLVAGITVVFHVLPRPTFSELEKRDLQQFPTYTTDSLFSGSYATAIGTWFSDTEPYREELLQLGMWVDRHLGIEMQDGEQQITFHSAATGSDEDMDMDMDMDTDSDDREISDYDNKQTANEAAKIANAGIIIVGTGDSVRALSAYHGNGGGESYANVCNTYKKRFPHVNVYCMVVPTAVEFYCPDAAKSSTRSELTTIRNTYAHLDDSVKAVDIYTTLGNHANENIYLRTDHHWAPLGAYYAAERFAHVAGVPFLPLSAYNREVVHGFVGTMYGYSKDISVKNSPEDFVYYTPKDSNYHTTYITYTIDRDYQVTAEGKAHKGAFFGHFKDGSSGAYCVFMGGDSKITQVRTSQTNGRRVLILKDSFGNALPGYLFGSFEEVHVVDGRYFTKNMGEYIAQNAITDILFANNVFKVYGGGKSYLKFLDQPGWPYK